MIFFTKNEKKRKEKIQKDLLLIELMEDIQQRDQNKNLVLFLMQCK